MEYRLLLSILPSLTAIAFAIYTRQVIPSLLVGLWLGSFIASPGLVSSVSKTVSYIMGMLSDQGNLDVILFLFVFSGLVSMIQIAGGVNGFAKLMARWVNGRRGTLLAAWALEPLTFVDCGFRVVAAGSVIKPLAAKFGVSRERLAYTLNNSSSPFIGLIPVATTYVGYMLGVLTAGMQVAGITRSPFLLFIQTIPFNFFSFTSIFIAFYSIFSPWQFSAMKAADDLAAGQKQEKEGESFPVNRKHSPAFSYELAEEFNPEEKELSLNQRKHMEEARDQMGVSMGKVSDPPVNDHEKLHEKEVTRNKAINMEHDHETEVESKLPPRAYNLVIPIGILIPLSFLMVWLDGRTQGDTLIEIFALANASRAMFLALFLTTLITAILYLLQGLTLRELTDRFIKGGNKLMVTIVILAVAWPIATVSQDLGLPQLINTTIGRTLPPVWVPLIMFLVTAAVTYFIGSSWGAWALMMPLAIPLASISGASIPMAAAAVFSGGTFGDVTSPLSGMAAMSSGIAEVEHMDYIRAMTPYNLTAGALAAILFIVIPFLFA